MVSTAFLSMYLAGITPLIVTSILPCSTLSTLGTTVRFSLFMGFSLAAPAVSVIAANSINIHFFIFSLITYHLSLLTYHFSLITHHSSLLPSEAPLRLARISPSYLSG